MLYFFIQFFFGCRLSEPALIFEEDVSVKRRKIVIRRLKKAREKDGFLETVYDIGATNAATNASMNAYNAGVSQNNGLFGGLAGLGGAAIKAFAGPGSLFL